MKSRTLYVLAVFSCLAATSVAQAATEQDAARRSDGGTVINNAGDCVRTRWNAGKDPCAAEQPVKTVTKVVEKAKPSPVIAKEERTVYFDFNKAALTPSAQATLNSLATKLKADTQIRQARVVGFADRVGSEVYNQKLSEKRANAVRDYLIAQGFAKMGATETKWFGESVPATQCGEDLKRPELIECLAKDRRVEVEIDYLTELPAGK